MFGTKPMLRQIEPEWLDELPAEHPDAKQSRHDLRRINAWMGNASTMAGVLRNLEDNGSGRRVIEIGAGDGEFLLSVARRMARRPGSNPTSREAVLVDRQYLLANNTTAQFAQLRWKVQAVKADVLDFLAQGSESDGTMIANLFLHHFPRETLQGILTAASRHASAFVAIEPRRSFFSWFFAHGLGWIGCNAVTRHDAPVSVRAGFQEMELSALWPKSPSWHLAEHRTGFFSHLFVARKLP